MTTTGAQTPAGLRDVFYRFALEHPSPDAAALDAYVRQYPEYAAALTEFAIELATDAILRHDDETLIDDDSSLGFKDSSSPTTKPTTTPFMGQWGSCLCASK